MCGNSDFKKSEQKVFQKEATINTELNEGILEIDLITPGPVQNCSKKHKLYKWTHNNCGGKLKLNKVQWPKLKKRH